MFFMFNLDGGLANLAASARTCSSHNSRFELIERHHPIHNHKRVAEQALLNARSGEGWLNRASAHRDPLAARSMAPSERGITGLHLPCSHSRSETHAGYEELQGEISRGGARQGGAGSLPCLLTQDGPAS
jgi:hypothetical protein